MNNKEVSIKFKNTVTGEAKLEKYAKTLERINAISNGINTGALKSVKTSATDISQLSKNTETLAKSTQKAFSYGLIKTFTNSLKNLVTTLSRTTDRSMNYLETLNLYQVAFKEVNKSIRESTQDTDKFINKLSEMYGLDESWLTNTVAKFKQLANAMHISGKNGTILSKILTQLSIDTSSLYNVDPSEAVSKFTSALAGQTKPVRSFGADITESTLQQTLSDLDIDRKISQLSYAEKRITIVISLMRQLTQVTNDWGNTIESPANQTRILSQQWERLQRAIGNLFLGVLGKVLPYLNAILMVITEIISSIASLFGFKIDNYNYGVTELSDSFDDLGGNIDKASSSAQKLKQGLRGFDRLNVITTPLASGNAGGAGVGGTGIDSRLSDALAKSYDNYMKKLENVKMKATEIRDKIMEWLGFERKIDKVTGDVYFKFKKITGGTVLGALAVGGMIYKGVKTVLTFLEKIGIIKIPSFSSIGNFVKQLSTSNLAKLGEIAGIIGMIAFAWSTIYKEIKNNPKLEEKVDKLKKSIDKLWTSLQKVYKKLKPAFSIIFGWLKDLGDTVKKVMENYVIRYFSQMVDTISGVASIISSIIDGDFKGAFNNLKEMISNLFENWKTTFNKIVGVLSGLPEKLGYWVGKAIDWIWSMIEETDWLELGGKIIDGILSIFSNVSKIEKVVKTAVKNFTDEIVKSFKDGTIVEKIAKVGGSIAKTILTAMTWPTQLGASVVGKFVNGIKKALGIETKKLTSKSGSSYGSSGGAHSGGGIKGASGGVFTPNGQKLDVRRFATGGLPPVGQMFIAREKGPELVGKIGSHTAVMNNEQIVGSVASGVYDAVYKANMSSNKNGTTNATFIIKVGDKELAKQVINDLQDMAKTNGKPIEIG